MPRATAQEEHAEDHAAHWAYSGEAGPDHWGTINEDFELCAHGREQSPINLVTTNGEDLPDITFHYQPSALNILNNGHTIQVTYDPGSFITVDGISYALVQLHFHSRSEHTIDGIDYPLELHLVHSTPEGNLAVVGIMVETGEAHPAFNAIVENAPGELSEVIQVEGATINALDMLPAIGTYYAYRGSLTTPPCTEGVKWHVMSTPIQMSQAQLDAMAGILHNNFRPIQDLYERDLVVDTESAAIK